MLCNANAFSVPQKINHVEIHQLIDVLLRINSPYSIVELARLYIYKNVSKYVAIF